MIACIDNCINTETVNQLKGGNSYQEKYHITQDYIMFVGTKFKKKKNQECQLIIDRIIDNVECHLTVQTEVHVNYSISWYYH